LSKLNVLFALLFAAAILIAMHVLQTEAGGLLPFTSADHQLAPVEKEQLRFCMYPVLFEYGIRVDWISGSDRAKVVRIPRDVPMIEVYASLARAFHKNGGIFRKAETTPLADKMLLEVADATESVVKVQLVEDLSIERTTGEIALLIDGLEISTHEVRDFMSIGVPLNFAVPHAISQATTLAGLAMSKGHYVLAQVAITGKEPDDEAITKWADQIFKSVPEASGVYLFKDFVGDDRNSHLRAVLNESSKRHLFLLNGVRQGSATVLAAAQESKVRTVTLAGSVGGIEEKPYIREQILTIAEEASRRGSAIGSVKASRATYDILCDELPRLRRKGYRFVAISSLVK
jgi:polysaccharide deacetylase 2 family uncharacterized protein YibQ